MSEWRSNDDPASASVDARIDSAAREGPIDTARIDVYSAVRDPAIITRPPDGRPMQCQPQWRKDFPIDWPQDHYVSRRDLAKFLVLTSAAFVVGQLWVGLQNVWRRGRGLPPHRKIIALSSLPIGGTLVFEYPGPHDPCILIRTAPDTLLAYSQKCTHLSCAVIPRVKEGIIHCPCHEGYFDLATGRNIAGPPPRPLPRIILEVRGGDVYATGVEERMT